MNILVPITSPLDDENISIKLETKDNERLYHLINSKYGTKIVISVYPEPKNMIGGEGSIFKTNFYYPCTDGVCDEFCSADTKNIPVKLFLQKFYATSNQAKEKPPRGYARKLLCAFIERLQQENGLADDAIIILEASGEVQGSTTGLVKMYQRMGFKIVALEEYGEPVYSGDTDEERRQRCTGEFNDVVEEEFMTTAMATRLADLISYCSTLK